MMVVDWEELSKLEINGKAESYLLQGFCFVWETWA